MRKAPSAVPARRHFAAQVFAMSGGDGLRLSLEPLLACHQTTLGWAIPCTTQRLAGQHGAARVEGWELCSVYASSTRHKAGSEELCASLSSGRLVAGSPQPKRDGPARPRWERREGARVRASLLAIGAHPLTCIAIPRRLPAALHQLPHPLPRDLQVLVAVAHLEEERVGGW